MKTLNVAQLANHLMIEVRKGNGHLPIVISSDPEGNSFGTIDPQYSIAYDAETPTNITIYPAEQFMLDDGDPDLETYKSSEEGVIPTM